MDLISFQIKQPTKKREHIYYHLIVCLYGKDEAEKEIKDIHNDVWVYDEEEEEEEGEKEFIEAVKNNDIDTIKSLFEKKQNGGFNKEVHCDRCKTETETYVDACYNILVCKVCNCTK